MPGDGDQWKDSLIEPAAIGGGDRFAIREGVKKTGSVLVTKVIGWPNVMSWFK